MLDQREIYAVVKEHTKLDNSKAHALANILWEKARLYGKAMKAETKTVEVAEVSDIPMTREELIKHLAKSVKGGNTQAGKLLSELEGFEVVSKDLEVTMVDYKDAPDYFFVSKKPENV